MAKEHANELGGKDWIKNSVSVWNDIRKTKEEKKIDYPAVFPVALATKLIQCFMPPSGKIVFDPFMGSGSTLVAAQQLGKTGVGVDISSRAVEIAESRVCGVPLAHCHCADSRELLKVVSSSSVDLVITSPPYWNILRQKHTVDGKDSQSYTDSDNDLGNIESYQEFIRDLTWVFAGTYLLMKPGAYMCLVVMDIRKKSEIFRLPADCIKGMESMGFDYDDMFIWDRSHEYNSLAPLGFPYVFRVNRVHEFILIFRRRNDGVF